MDESRRAKHSQAQRDMINGQWNLKKYDAEDNNDMIVYRSQEEMSFKITDFLLSNGLIVTLCASPQWGKTGVALHVAYTLCTFIDYKKIIIYIIVFILSGMNDNDWKIQTKDRMLDCWKDNVYHRGNLKKFFKKISKKDLTDCLIIIDECHIANQYKHTITKELKKAQILDIDYLKNSNIKILQISATPSSSLIDAEKWGPEYHKKIVPKPEDSYVSFETILNENRIRPLYDLEQYNKCEELFSDMCLFSNPRIHLIRLLTKGKNNPYKTIYNNLKKLCNINDFDIYELNAKNKQKETILNILDNIPTKHTIIVLKNMFGAAKTLNDKYIGCVHESKPKQKDYSSEVQGLPGRMCGHNKKCGVDAPIIYCNVNIITKYITLLKNNFNYEVKDFVWKERKLVKKKNSTTARVIKPSYASPIVVDGIEYDENVSENIYKQIGPYDTHEELIEVLRQIYTTASKGACHYIDNYWYTSKLTPKKEMTKDRIITKEYFDTLSKGTCISSTNKGSQWCVFPVYPNINSNPDEVMWYARYLDNTS